jgi:hypothetical protein
MTGCVVTVSCLAGAALCPCGAAISTPAEIAMAGAAFPAFSATFSTCDAVAWRPVRLHFILRLYLCAAPTKFSIVVFVPPTSCSQQPRSAGLLNRRFVIFTAVCHNFPVSVLLRKHARGQESFAGKSTKFCDVPVINDSVGTPVTNALTRTNCGQMLYGDSQ